MIKYSTVLATKDVASDAELLGIFEQLLLVHSWCTHREGACLGPQHHRHDALVAATGFLLPKMVGMGGDMWGLFVLEKNTGPQHKMKCWNKLMLRCLLDL